jgi:hypothetical protein
LFFQLDPVKRKVVFALIGGGKSRWCRSDEFDLVSGQLEYKLERLPPGGNSSQTVVVRPRKFGYFNFTAAEVRKRLQNCMEQNFR